MCCLMSHAVSQSLLCATYASCLTDVSDYLIVSQLSRLSQLCPVSLDYCVSTENCLICLHGGVCVDFFHMVICKGGLKRKETEL
jgi:hypothetical protein